MHGRTVDTLPGTASPEPFRASLIGHIRTVRLTGQTPNVRARGSCFAPLALVRLKRLELSLTPDGYHEHQRLFDDPLMDISLHLSAEEEALLKRAAACLRLSKTEFVRISITKHAAHVLATNQHSTALDTHYIGQGGGLREPSEVDNPRKRAVLERLRQRYGYEEG